VYPSFCGGGERLVQVVNLFLQIIEQEDKLGLAAV
jgi:hypothetical protein